MRRGATAVVLAIVATAGLAGCAGGKATPLSSAAMLDSGIAALRAASGYTIVQQTKTSTSPVEDHIVVQNPDRLSVNGTTIAVGSTAYRLQPNLTWAVEHRTGIEAELRRGALLYVNLLSQATKVTRQGTNYTVAGDEARTLLRSTGLQGFKTAAGVSLTATVQAGRLQTEVLQVTNPAVTVTITVSDVGSSPPVTVPSTAKPPTAK